MRLQRQLKLKRRSRFRAPSGGRPVVGIVGRCEAHSATFCNGEIGLMLQSLNIVGPAATTSRYCASSRRGGAETSACEGGSVMVMSLSAAAGSPPPVAEDATGST